MSGVRVLVGTRKGAFVLTADGPFGAYESFSLPEPPRLVIDLPEATYAVKRPVAVPKQGPIKRLRSSQYKVKPVKTTRLVLDLSANLPYQVQAKNGQFRVLIGDAIAKAGAAEAPTPSAETLQLAQADEEELE